MSILFVDNMDNATLFRIPYAELAGQLLNQPTRNIFPHSVAII